MEQALYELPEGWEWKNLTDVTRIGAERGFIPEVNDGKAPFIGMSNIDQDTGLDSEYELRDFESVRKGYTKFQKNAVLLAKITPCTENNKTALIQDINGGYATTEVYPIHSLSEIYPHYLLQFLRSPSIRELLVSKMEGATGRQRVPTDAVSSLKIPLPPINEQKRIVAKLDALFTRIDTAITHLQQTLELSKALFASAQQSIFDGLEHTHQVVSLDDVCTITSSKRIFKSDYIANGVSFFRTKEIVELSKNKSISTELFISNEKFEQIKVKFGVPKKGDLLFSAVGTIGVTWIVDDREFYFKDGNLLWLKDFKRIDVAFLRESITAVLAEKIRNKSQGAAYKAISIRNLKDFHIPLPPIKEQQRIVTHLDALAEHTRSLETTTQEKLNDLTSLKASLLDAAFKGQL